VPFLPVFLLQNLGLFDLELVSGFINLCKVVGFQINHIVRNHTVVWQTNSHVDEKLVAVHKQR
jgi:hypothetical protein